MNILSRPYKIYLIPDDVVGGFTAGVEEFRGCLAEGDTIEEALSRLNETAQAWIAAEQEAGRAIPEPKVLEEDDEYSGRLLLRLPKTVHRRLAQWADQNGTSINQTINSAVTYFLGRIEQRHTPYKVETKTSNEVVQIHRKLTQKRGLRVVAEVLNA